MRRQSFRSAATETAPRGTASWWQLGGLKQLSIILMAGLCATLFAAEPQGVVLVGAGSSVPLPLYRKWAELYNKSNQTVQLQYVAMGNVEGISQISHGV